MISNAECENLHFGSDAKSHLLRFNIRVDWKSETAEHLRSTHSA